jgi:hypothetical protein
MSVPRIKLTKSAIDALPTGAADVVYWDTGCPGFGVKVTPKGRKVFLVLYRTGKAGSKLRKYTIGPYGRVMLHQARVAAQRVFSAKLEGRDPAREKREARIREVTARIDGRGRGRVLCPTRYSEFSSWCSRAKRSCPPGLTLDLVVASSAPSIGMCQSIL